MPDINLAVTGSDYACLKDGIGIVVRRHRLGGTTLKYVLDLDVVGTGGC